MKTYCKHLAVLRKDIMNAYVTWRSSRAGKKNRWRVIEEYGNAWYLVDQIYREILDRRLSFRPIKIIYRREGTHSKVRRIGIESVKQQICEYVILTKLHDLYEDKIGFYQCAGVKGKGTLFAVKALKRYISKAPETAYYVKGDIKKCYESTKHSVVKNLYAKYTNSSDLLYIIDCLLYANEMANGKPVGLNLGGAFSLFTMNLLLSQAYHYIDNMGKRRRDKWIRPVIFQLWYMDDYFILSKTKSQAIYVAKQIEKYLKDQLGMTVKPWHAEPVSTPIDMCGFVVSKDKVIVRDRIFKHARKAYKRFRLYPNITTARPICSYYGYLKHADTEKYMERNDIRALTNKANEIVSVCENYSIPIGG